jgi:hypothetical protein
MTKRPRLELKRRDEHDGSKLTTQRRGPTGPRTELGKQRSKLNAVKYGIFSSVMLLGSESKEEFDRLVSGLMDHYRPVGTLEEALVDHLAASLWRCRRLLMAEKAEIAKTQPAEKISEKEMMRNSVLRRLMPSSGTFEIAFLTNSRLDFIQTLGALKGIRDDVRKHGLSWERDRKRLEDVFGKTKEPLDETEGPNKALKDARFITRYWEAVERSHDNTELAAQNGEAVVAELDKLTEYLDGINLEWFDEEGIERYRASTAALIPSPDVAEKLLRYQVTLERSVERTITQLERLQQMRAGQPVAPPINVQIAG